MDAERLSNAELNRRSFLQGLGVAGFGAMEPAWAGGTGLAPEEDPYGVLIDTTLCMCCRTCEKSCAEANNLPPPRSGASPDKRTSDTQFVVINGFENDEADMGYVFIKRQCMHCLQPACASACLTKAMFKTDAGPVIWRQDKCMGCRYCMISCPFDIPKFEYDSATPRIRKCNLCADRLADGEIPACVENCPAEALVFGRRSELLTEARRRIAEAPDEYVNHIYGEHEAGGTSVLYLAAVPFEDLGLPTDLERGPYPELTREFLYGVPIVLTLVPALLLGLSQATKRSIVTAEEGEGHD